MESRPKTCAPGRTVIAAWALAASASLVSAQGLVARTFRESDGLPSSRVLDVRRPPGGPLWVVTREGVATYDGASWQDAFAGGLPDDVAPRHVRFDDAGGAWVASEFGDLFAPRADGLRAVPGPLGADRWDLAQEFELWPSDAARPGFVLVLQSRGLLLGDGDSWRALPDPEVTGTVHSAEPAFGRFFLGCERGLFELDPARTEVLAVHAGLPPGPVLGLARHVAAGAEKLWVLGSGWVAALVPEGPARLVAPVFTRLGADGLVELDEEEQARLVLAPDGAGGVVFGNSWTLVRVDGRSGEARRLERWQGFSPAANALLLDEEGLLWVAGDLGLTQLPALGVDIHTREAGLLEDEVSALGLLQDGTLVAGHVGGISLRTAAGWRARPFEADPVKLARGRVMDLDVGVDGTIWLAGGALGVGRLRPGAEDAAVRWSPVEPPPEGFVCAVLALGPDEALVGTSDGLFHLVGDEVTRRSVSGMRPYVRRLLRTSAGRTLLATPGGLFVEEGEHWQFHPLPGRYTRGVFSLLERADGAVWCGTEHGLFVFDGETLRPAPAPYALERPVYSLVTDRDARLWVGTDLGFRIVDGGSLVDLAWLVPWTGHEANRAAALCAPDGRVWLGTNEALSTFPAGFRVEAPPVSVVGREALVAGRPRSLTAALVVVYERDSVEVVVRAGTLRADATPTYRYRLAGEAAWTELVGGAEQALRLDGLPPGRHVLEVQAAAPGGPFGPTWSSPAIDVRLPLLRRWWFHALLVLGSGALSVAVHRYGTQRRLTQRLEQEVEARRGELEASVTELAKTDRLRSLGFLAGGIAHDLRNVLTVLTGNVSLLREALVDRPDTRPQLDAVDTALDRATELSTQLQTFATGGAPVKRSVDLSRLVEQCAQLVLSGASTRLELHLPDDLPPVEADEAQLRQVLENLLLNARQAQGAGGWIDVRGAALVADGRRVVRLTLANGGPGIPVELQRHVFDPFFTTREGGSGLGLTTAYSIVARHGGSLALAESRPGRTELRLTLPAAAVAPEARAGREAPRPPSGRGRVLVVDDQEAIRRTLARMLTRLGYEATTVAGSEAAVGAVVTSLRRGRPFACAVLDLTLPGDIGGEEVLERLHRLDPKLPALASSGYASGPQLLQAEAAGFAGVLPKPYRLEELGRALAAVARDAAPEAGLRPA